MKTKLIKIDRSNIDSAAICKAAKLVDEGKLVAFPTETVYGIAGRVRTDTLERLNKVKSRSRQKHYTLHIGHKEDVRKYVPTMGLRTEKLLRRAWPGPLTVVFELSRKDMEKQRHTLENEVFKNLYKNNSIGIRCPCDVVAAKLLAAIENAVVAPSANTSGGPAAVNAGQVLENLAGRIEVVLDAGECEYKKSSTVVKIGKDGLEILRQGVYGKEELEAMSQVRFLFVCTGNTCRSPMAEGMFKKYLAEKLRCTVDQLQEKGYKVSSAGIMSMSGFPASSEAVKACADRGIDISAHKNRVLSERLVEESDCIFAMSQMHYNKAVEMSEEAADRCVLLIDGQGVPDPIGQPQSVYRQCADLIESAVKKRVSELMI